MTELDPTATDVQPLEGQGAPTADPTSEVQPEGQGHQDDVAGLYDLQSVPEEFRADVERIAKDIDRKVNGKLQEAAEYRKGWTAYEQLGLRDIEADSLAPIVELARAIGSEDSDTAQRVILELAKAAGLEVEGLDDEDPADPALDDPQTAYERRIAELERREAEREQAKAMQEAEQQALQELSAEWAEVEQQHGRALEGDEAELLRSLAERFIPDPEVKEPIKTAYSLMQQIMGLGEKGLVEAQAKQPKAAEPAGRASTAVEPPATFEEAERLFRERLSASAA